MRYKEKEKIKETALQLYKKVFALNPDNKIVCICIGNTLTLMKEREKAK